MEPQTIETDDHFVDITVSVENALVRIDIDDTEKLCIAWLYPDQARTLLCTVAKAYLIAKKELEDE